MKSEKRYCNSEFGEFKIGNTAPFPLKCSRREGHQGACKMTVMWTTEKVNP
jgi:hypothetical protein